MVFVPNFWIYGKFPYGILHSNEIEIGKPSIQSSNLGIAEPLAIFDQHGEHQPPQRTATHTTKRRTKPPTKTQTARENPQNKHNGGGTARHREQPRSGTLGRQPEINAPAPFCDAWVHADNQPAAHGGQRPACFPQARFRVAFWVSLMNFIAALYWQTLCVCLSLGLNSFPPLGGSGAR